MLCFLPILLWKTFTKKLLYSLILFLFSLQVFDFGLQSFQVQSDEREGSSLQVIIYLPYFSASVFKTELY